MEIVIAGISLGIIALFIYMVAPPRSRRPGPPKDLNNAGQGSKPPLETPLR